MKKDPNLSLIVRIAIILSLALNANAQHNSIESYEGSSTCLECHPGVANEVMSTLHWTWSETDEFTGKEVGKINIINNYCVAVPSNEPRCTSCHIGVGWEDSTFDHSDSSKIDCLVCHDRTGTYKKTPTGAGAPDPTVDLLAAARSAGLPTRNNCGSCHFYGGGAEGVKHGSMDSSLSSPSEELDFHMGGLNFQCTTCHTPDEGNQHEVLGSRYSKATPDNQMCQDCHGETPHSSTLTNNHALKVACQTCHIPTYARGGKPTKMFWDWTTAGEKNEDGSDKTLTDENGYVVYQTKKGTFEWAENVVPEYTWFNGNVVHVTLDDPVMQGQVVKINELQGNIDDPNSLIFPIKRFTGIQPYDAGAGTLAIPNLFPNNAEDTSAFWKAYDWPAALESGMAAVGREFVGPVGYVETEMTWIQNHMVAPSEQSLTCTDCHVAGGRLNFTKLGYAPERANELQLMMQSDYWGPYGVYPDGVTVNTGSWLGFVDISEAPWVYVYNMGRYLYIDEAYFDENGGWAYLPKY